MCYNASTISLQTHQKRSSLTMELSLHSVSNSTSPSTTVHQDPLSRARLTATSLQLSSGLRTTPEGYLMEFYNKMFPVQTESLAYS